MTTRRHPVLALLAIASTLVASMVPLAGPVAAVTPDVAAIGDLFSYSGKIDYAAGYKRFPAGPDTGAPSAVVDSALHTVDVTVNDAGRTSVLTMAWPARIGIWALGIDGTDPEQHVDLRRGSSICHLTAGRLEIRQATVSAGGGVAGLTADVGDHHPLLDDRAGFRARVQCGGQSLRYR
ncbi:MAG TPA: hypothetical protein VFF32_14685 [Dermatophilaceae bacterium]|nr:hypothetical protein [Dermatophilaceae bacterium]